MRTIAGMARSYREIATFHHGGQLRHDALRLLNCDEFANSLQFSPRSFVLIGTIRICR
jgi:hypothetical protein